MRTVTPWRMIAMWMTVSTLVRLPVAMAPLMYVFMAKSRFQDFGAGAILVGAFVGGELLGSLLTGIRQSEQCTRTKLSFSFAACAIALLALLGYEQFPLWMIAVLAATTGITSAAAPGEMQGILLQDLHASSVPKVLSAVRVQSVSVFMAAPILLTIVTRDYDVHAALTICAIAMIVGAGVIFTLPQAKSFGVAKVSKRVGLIAIARSWPIYLSGLAGTFVIAIADMLIAPLLAARGIEAKWAGPILAVFFLVGVAGSTLYGMRTNWPGSLPTQSFVVTLFMVTGIIVTAIATTLPYIFVGMAMVGSGAMVLLMVRTLGLRATLPESVHAAAFSFNYAVSCSSYLICAIILGLSITRTTPEGTLLICAALVTVMTVTARISEMSRGRQALATPRKDERHEVNYPA